MQNETPSPGAPSTLEDRLRMRERPPGRPIMRQTWRKLLFLHWPVPADELRPLIPGPLKIDTFDGTAWIAITPLKINGVRPPGLPGVPWLSSSLEINVRTYVHLDGAPGIWFFSLDASNPFAVWGARLGFSLPYFRAAMRFHESGATRWFKSRRTHAGSATAEFDAAWELGERLPQAVPESQEFFLIERYCLYTASGDRLYRARIHHHPWPLRSASLVHLNSTMIQAQGIRTPEGLPRLHAQAAPLDVDVWRPEPVA